MSRCLLKHEFVGVLESMHRETCRNSKYTRVARGEATFQKGWEKACSFLFQEVQTGSFFICFPALLPFFH